MQNTTGSNPARRWFWSMTFTWTLILISSFTWNMKHEKDEVHHFTRLEANALIDYIIVTRVWNARHGGVYVPSNEASPPNPHLKGLVPERDITTPQGKELTLINPAYMIRQINEILTQRAGRMAHITSLKPIRPENAPDAWESKALKTFEQGAGEFQEQTEIDGKPYMRLMRPLFTEKACLQCHAQQGYKEGDIRGGISASLPMADHLVFMDESIRAVICIHGLLWLFGIAGISLSTRQMSRHLSKQEEHARQLQNEVKQRSKTEEDLVEKTMYLDNILASSTEYAIATTDLNFRITYYNAKAEEFFGRSAKEVIGKTVQEMHIKEKVEPGRFERAIRNVRKHGEHCYTAEQETADGRRILNCRMSGIYSADGEMVGFALFTQDVTEQMKVEEHRERLLAELKEKNRELEKFAYTISHDLKSPLLTINGFLGRLEKDIAEEKQDYVQDDVRRILSATAKMRQLLDGLLELSRVGRIVNPPEDIKLNEVVSEVLVLLGASIAEKKVHVDVREKLPVVWADRQRLLLVYENLIGNALKYSGDCKQPRIEVGARQENDEIICHVKDNGIGIEPQFHEMIFELFEKLDAKAKSTGVGLALCKRIIEAHGGRIWVESEGSGKGSMFCFTLPVSASS